MSFDRFAVVRVPFPFTDRNATKNRPALVLSDPVAFNTPAGHSVMAMITSQAISYKLRIFQRCQELSALAGSWRAGGFRGRLRMPNSLAWAAK